MRAVFVFVVLATTLALGQAGAPCKMQNSKYIIQNFLACQFCSVDRLRSLLRGFFVLLLTHEEFSPFEVDQIGDLTVPITFFVIRISEKIGKCFWNGDEIGGRIGDIKFRTVDHTKTDFKWPTNPEKTVFKTGTYQELYSKHSNQSLR